MKYMSYCLTIGALLSFSLSAMELSPEDLKKKYGAKYEPGHGPVICPPSEVQYALALAHHERHLKNSYLSLLSLDLRELIIKYIQRNYKDFMALFHVENSHIHIVRTSGSEKALIWELYEMGCLRGPLFPELPSQDTNSSDTKSTKLKLRERMRRITSFFRKSHN